MSGATSRRAPCCRTRVCALLGVWPAARVCDRGVRGGEPDTDSAGRARHSGTRLQHAPATESGAVDAGGDVRAGDQPAAGAVRRCCRKPRASAERPVDLRADADHAMARNHPAGDQQCDSLDGGQHDAVARHGARRRFAIGPRRRGLGAPGTAAHRTAAHRTAAHRTAAHRTAAHRTAAHRRAPHRRAPPVWRIE